ncbi:MAG: outer membrane protein assembly factor BamD [bacterium]
MPNSLLPIIFLIFMGMISCSSSNVLSEQDYYLAGKEAVRDTDYKEIRKNFKDLESHYPTSKHLSEARFAIAESYLDQGELDDAILEFQRFLNYHPNNEKTPDALLGLGKSYSNQVDDYELDQTFTRKAIKVFRRLAREYPGTPQAGEGKEKETGCRLLLAEHEKAIADFYHRIGAYNSAITRYRELIINYPETEVIEDTYLKLADSYRSLGSRAEAAEILKLAGQKKR